MENTQPNEQPEQQQAAQPRKYHLTGNTIQHEGRTLYQVQADRDIELEDGTIIKAGTLGGYIESEANLSQEGLCWVADNAKVYDYAKVSGNAKVSGSAQVSGNAQISDNAQVRDARICDNVTISGNAEVSGSAYVYGYADIHGDACINKAVISGNAVISGHAIIDYAVVKGKGEVCDEVVIHGLGNTCVTGCISGNSHISSDLDSPFNIDGNVHDSRLIDSNIGEGVTVNNCKIYGSDLSGSAFERVVYENKDITDNKVTERQSESRGISR